MHITIAVPFDKLVLEVVARDNTLAPPMTPRTNLVQDLAVKYQVTPEIIIANTNLHQVLIEMFVQGIIRARIADFSKSTDTETSTIECLLWSAIIKHARALFPEVNIDFEYQDLDQRQQ